MKDRKQVFAEYVIENQNKFYRLAYSYVGNREAAQDIVQNAIVKGLENIEKLRKLEYLGTWFYRIVINESMNYLRDNKHEIASHYEDLLNVQESESTKQSEIEVMEYILNLPIELKTVIILRFYENLALKEIAKITRVKLSTAKYRLYRALELLKKQMEEKVS